LSHKTEDKTRFPGSNEHLERKSKRKPISYKA